MEDLLYRLINPPASFVMWLLFSREGAEIMPNILLFMSVLICIFGLWCYRSGKL